DFHVTGVQTCALPIYRRSGGHGAGPRPSPGRSARAVVRSTIAPRSEVHRRQLRPSGLVGGLAHPQLLQDLLLDLGGDVRIVPEERPDVLLALPELIAVVGVPGPGLAYDPLLHPHVDQRPFAGDAPAVDHVHLARLEGRGALVLHDLDPGPVTVHLAAVLERLDAAHIQPHRRVELQRSPTAGGLRATEHDADLLAELVDEDGGSAGVVQRAGDLPQRLAHQPGLQADVAVAHLALDLRPGDQCGDRVDDDDVQRAGAD